MQTNLTTPDFTQKADHPVSGTWASSVYCHTSGIKWPPCNSPDWGQPWLAVERQLNLSLPWALVAGKGSHVLSCLWTAQSADQGMCLFFFWHLWVYIWCTVFRFGYPIIVKTLTNWRFHRRGIKKITGWEPRSQCKYVKRLEELDLYNLKMRRLTEDPNVFFNYPIGKYKENGARLFSDMNCEMTRQKWTQLAAREIYKTLRRSIFAVIVNDSGTSYAKNFWHFHPWRYSKSNWAVKKPGLALKFILLWARLWTMWPPGSPPALTILWCSMAL